ncbi:MAG: PspC domain-containing protein [Gaiella sp.]
MQNTTTDSTLPPSTPRRLVRTSDRKLAGVAAGIGHYLGIDPTIVRIAFLVLTAAGGIGVLLYLICWLVMPRGEAPSVTPATPLDTWAIVGVAGLVVGVALLFGWHGLGGGTRAVAAAALVVGGILLLGRFRNDAPPGASTPGDSSWPVTPPPSPPPAAPLLRAPDTPTAEIDETADTAVTPQIAADGAEPAPSASSVARHSAPARRGVTAGVLSLVAITLGAGVAAVLAEIGEGLDAADVIAASVVIVGLGLVVSAFVARAVGLVVVGLVLTLALLTVRAAQPIIDDGTGVRSYTPLSAGDLRTEYHLGAGELTLNLSLLELADGETRKVKVKVGFGAVTIIAPDEPEVLVRSSVDGGEIVAFGRRIEGLFQDGETTVPGNGDSSAGRLVIDLDLGFGEGTVRRG